MSHHVDHVTVLLADLLQCRFEGRNFDFFVDVADVYSVLARDRGSMPSSLHSSHRALHFDSTHVSQGAMVVILKCAE